MNRNKLISIIECSVKNKLIISFLAISLIGASGMMLADQANLSNNNLTVNKTVLAGTVNNDGNKACVINGNDSLVLYTSSNTSSIAGYISVGEMLTINSYSNGYYNVTVQETGVTGYIASSNMQKIVSGVGYNLTSLSGAAYTTNVSTVVNLKEETTMNSTTLAKLKDNTLVTLLGKQGDWYKVSDNGTIGYIYGEYIAIANSNTTGSSSSSSSTITSSSNSNATGTTKSNNSSLLTKVTLSKSNTSTTGITSSTGSSSNSSTAQIKWVLDNSEFSNPNTVVIENGTGKAIPNNKLATYMRDWILNAQYNYSGFADCNGTMWAGQWLNTISNSQLVSYFESANGNEALNENITAGQLNKAAELLSDTLVKDDYNPFTIEQATTYIKEMLAQSYPNQVITKVVLHSGLYYIYTKQGGDNTPWWYVNASTGYATGV